MSEKEIKEFIDYFGDALPNPEHYPMCFMHYVKLWKFYKERDKKN